MTIQGFVNSAIKRDRFGNFQSNTASFNFADKSSSEIKTALRENVNFQLHEAHSRIQQQQRERRRAPRRQQGSVRLSNTDTLARARQVRARLLSKLQEVYGSDMDERARGGAAMDIQLQISRVDQQMTAIRRRERAVEEERMTRRRDDTPEARRRRARDMQERRIYVRRDFLYHADKGGFDPNNPLFTTNLQSDISSVAFDIGGNIGTMDIASVDAGLDVDFNLEVVL
jgi:hypothetical protein